jgi:hypothetical protein
MTRSPNLVKCILGAIVLALLFIGTWATTTGPHSATSKDKISNNTSNHFPTARLNAGNHSNMAPQGDPSACANVFEIEGNAVDDSPSGLPDDWNDLNPSTDPPNPPGFVTGPAGNALIRTFVVDSGPNDQIYTQGGSKDFLDIPSWMHTTGSVPDKDDITHAYAALYHDAITTHQVLVFGGDRFATNGDSNIGFWFFQSPISLNANGSFSGIHTDGDIFLLSAFTGGGGTSVIRVLKWVGTNPSACVAPAFIDPKSKSNSFPNGSLCDITATAGPSGAGTGIVNPAAITASWPYTAKGQKPACTTGPCSIPTGAFFEGCIDLSLLSVAAECFSTFLLETRSSADVDAVLKDFAVGSFNTCVSISVTKTASPTEACQGTPVNYTYTVTNNGAVSVNVTLIDDNGTPANPADDIDVTGTGGTTLASGETKTFNRNGVTLPVGTTTNTVTATATDPAFGGTQTKTASATVIIDPTPSCSVSPSTAAICAGGSQTFTANPTGGTPPYTFLWNTGATTQSITASTAGTYTVTITDSKGCTTFCSASLTVNPNPTCSISGPLAACAGATGLTYSSSGSNVGSHSWSISGNGTIVGSTTGSAVTVNASAGGSFTLTDLVTSSAECTSSCSLTVVVHSNPTVSINTVACSTSSQITLTATPSGGSGTGYTFSWSGPGGFTSTSQNITANQTGTFTVTVTDSNGCTSASTSRTVGLCAP